MMKFAKKTDIIIIAAVALLGLAIWLLYKYIFLEKGYFAELYYKSELVERIELSKAQEGTFSIPELPEVVFRLYGDGSIAFIESDCPDKVCIHSGKLKQAGQFAACLPNEIYVKIVSVDEASDKADIVIG